MAGDQITPQQLIDLGWTLHKDYDHDDFHTKVMTKGPMAIDLTYAVSSGKKTLHTADFYFPNDVPYTAITYDQAVQLTSIF